MRNLAASASLVAGLGAACSVDCARAQSEHAAQRPRLIEDAIFTIDHVAGSLALFADVDADGRPDLVVPRGPRRGEVHQLDIVSSLSGATLRTLWCAASAWTDDLVWDVCGDVDRDGMPDLLVARPESGALECAGTADVISSATGASIRQHVGCAAHERLGSSLVALDDVDCDGVADYAIGAVEAGPTSAHPSGYPAGGGGGGGSEPYKLFADGSRLTLREYHEQCLAARSTRGGYVSVRSGKDGSEIWRRTGCAIGHGFGAALHRIGDQDGDRMADLVTTHDVRSPRAALVLSAATGSTIASVLPRFGPVAPIGDIDGDGMDDLVLEENDRELNWLDGFAVIVSGARHVELLRVPYLDMSAYRYGVTRGVGDIDGDGCADIAMGEPNFHIRGPGNPGFGGSPLNLRAFTLQQAAAIESDPWNAFSCESGCAIVRSGRSSAVIFGAWGAPGSMRGLGFDVIAIPDISGDAAPELIVASSDTAYVFAGPGKVSPARAAK